MNPEHPAIMYEVAYVRNMSITILAAETTGP
jgi:hypothetical protein